MSCHYCNKNDEYVAIALFSKHHKRYVCEFHKKDFENDVQWRIKKI